MRDYERLAAAFRTLTDEPMPASTEATGCGDPAGPSRSPASPRVFYEALDEAIAASSSMYDALCDWRDVGSSLDSPPTASAAATAATAADDDDKPA